MNAFDGSTRRHFSLLALATLLCALAAGGCASTNPADYRPGAIREKILAGLPAGWSEAEPTEQQRDLLAAYFDDPRTVRLALNGPRLDQVSWRDKEGQWHHEVIYRECLYLWIVPADARADFRTLNPKVEEQPRCFYLSRAGKVYGEEGGYVVDPVRMKAILETEGLQEVQGGDAPFSWPNWRREIRTNTGPEPHA